MRRFVLCCLTVLILGMSYFWSPAAQASLQDDRFDGNIFALYAGNGSLVPPRMPLSQAIAEHRPSLLVFYLDDSRDCKQFASVVSQLQAPYGRAVEFIPVNADTVQGDRPKDPAEAGFYYQGVVPQVVVFDQQGKVRLNQTGLVAYDAIDDAMRSVLNLPERSQTETTRPRILNEINTELVQ